MSFMIRRYVIMMICKAVMSNSSALEIEEIVTVYQELLTLNYFVMAGAVLFIYDYMITIGQEIDFIWSAPLNGATIVFSLNRYVNLATSLFNILQFVPWDSQELHYHREDYPGRWRSVPSHSHSLHGAAYICSVEFRPPRLHAYTPAGPCGACYQRVPFCANIS
ncbi:hypothetical protein A0H81_07276 [Grifola frondosa]|uniref:DUF6533 domain-containing protein n=1 Tax=Grifola frondosa TaxID=5627 RepID=A0A1C7M923_GRIFR|nr:hypothetical protein A0H81_07276 [Grifola frondosa]